MGRPLKEDMGHMVGGDEKKDISFVDMEQAQKNIDIAKKRKSGINIDLDFDFD